MRWPVAVVGAGSGAGIAAASFAIGQAGGGSPRVWWIAALAVSLGAGAGWLGGRWLSARLAPLVSAAEDLAEGRRARLPSDEAVQSRDEVGRLAAALRDAADVVERRVAAITEDQTRFGAILSGMVEGVLVLDRPGRILLLNLAMERMLGCRASEAVGRHWLDVIRQHDFNELIRAVIQSGEPSAATITIDEAGGAHTFAVQGSVTRRPGGEADDLRAVFVFHDVTALKRLERVRSDFIANVSHELRTPLTSIIGYVEALLDGVQHDTTKREEFLRIIKTHADRLSALVHDLLQLSQIESGDYRWRRDSVDVGALVRRSVALVHPLAQRRQIALRCTNEVEALCVVGDEEKLTQVLVNLLDNAVKYTEAGGSVEVTVQSSDGHAIVRVRDTGIGIPPADRDRIFERFYRVDRARSRESGGTGLGLSIVKHIVEAHGGTVSVDSRLGHGSVFTVTLPQERETPPG
ncbi:MAG: two-component system histidine kinase PnpS [Nitrospirota bacterium]